MPTRLPSPAWVVPFVLACAAAPAAESRLTNVSVRSAAGEGGETLIVGFAVAGTAPKPVLIRGIGPSLTPFGVTGAVTDPQVRLYAGAAELGRNDNWGGGEALAAAFRAVGAFGLPSASRDAALLESLPPGAYSVHLVADSGPGIALVECYDAAPEAAAARIGNLSARSLSGTGGNVLTIGFSVSGGGPKTVLIRGIGPSLASFGVAGALGNSRLRLFDRSGTEIADNDDWSGAVTPPEVFAGAGAFPLAPGSSDAVLFFALEPGTYTAQVGGSTGTATGQALIEIYEVTAPPVPVITIQPVANASSVPPFDPGAGTISPGPDALPVVTFQSRPQYPFELRRASITGQALVDFHVKSDGTVANAVALRATDFRLGDSAVSAVQTWRFVPGRRNGRLVTTHMQVPIIYTLND